MHFQQITSITKHELTQKCSSTDVISGPDVAVEGSPNSNVPYAKRIGNPLILMRSCSWKSPDSLLLCILRTVSTFCVCMRGRNFLSSLRKVPLYLCNKYNSLLGKLTNNGTRQQTCKNIEMDATWEGEAKMGGKKSNS